MTKEPQGNLYAVYGTLRQGYGNHRILDNEFSEYLGTMRTNPEFKMVTLGGFPGVIPGGTQAVTIEVYRVTDSSVDQRLDWLEGYPRFYQKMEVETDWGTANMYILSEAEYGHLPIVTSGDWTVHIKEKRSTNQNNR